MIKAFRLTAWCVAIALVSILIIVRACSFFPESSFDLAQDSRLPKWFALPANLTRSQVSVHLDYYILLGGRRADFTLLGPKNEVLAKVTGTAVGNEPIKLERQPPAFPPGYPSYEIITVRGVTELIEHRNMEPIFYISDDPTVWNKLLFIRLLVGEQWASSTSLRLPAWPSPV